MGKGYKRKTRWRTLNIADCPSAPPGDEDDEDGICKTRDNKTRNNGQDGCKSSVHSWRESKNENRVATGDSADASPLRSQPKFIFDENEYTRITTPRQDVLFKKGYLARKKVWTANNASTSVTPSTTESQSASHSTADGSETMEDQQLLDYRENGIESFPPPAEPAVQMSYGTFYDHSSGYYYEYPMMVMGPSMSEQPMHNIFGSIPCQAVPLRPIEWVNPSFVPNLDQPYCFVDYQNSQTDQQYPTTTIDEMEETASTEHINEIEEPVENGNGSTSWAESIASEEHLVNDDDHNSQCDKYEPEETQDNENGEVTGVDSNLTNEPALETVLSQQLHVSHVLPPVSQSYMYPGHFMFGPALVNVNGMTLLNEQMIRTNEMTASTATFARYAKKKRMRHRKIRRSIPPDIVGVYGRENEDHSCEAKNTKIQTSAVGANTFVPNSITTSRPLNPDCKEFVFKATNIELQNNTSHNDALITTTTTELPSVEHNAKESQPVETKKLINHTELPCKSMSTQNIIESPTEMSTDISIIEYATEAISNESHQINGLCETQETEIGVDVTCAEFNDIVAKLEEDCTKLSIDNKSLEMVIVKKCDWQLDEASELHDVAETQRLENHENLYNNDAPKEMHNGGVKVNHKEISESKLDEQYPCTSEADTDIHINGVPIGIDAIEAQLSANTSNEDSGFESQTHFSDHPITDAVMQWLRRANSPELFITTMSNGGGMIEANNMEDDELDDNELSKNLKGNPMSALSVNSIVNDVEIMSSRMASCGEFARVNNYPNDNEVITIKKKKKRSKNGKKRVINSIDSVVTTDKKLNNDGKLNRRQQRKKRRATLKLHEKSAMEQCHDVCEFTEKDSDAGMRVATSTRINLDQVELIIKNDENEKRIKSSRDKVVERITMDVDQIKTFEQGEIVVSIDGKLLPTTVYGGRRSGCDEDNILDNQLVNVNEKNSISIEEPDLLECWEAGPVESINLKQSLKDQGFHYFNEVNDDINCTKVDAKNLELVRKYYTLARGSVQSFSSIEDGVSDVNQLDTQSQSKLIKPQRIIETLCSEKISVTEGNDTLNKHLPIDEGIEIYESCYTGRKPPTFITPNFYKSHLLRDEDGPIPCRATCCMIQ